MVKHKDSGFTLLELLLVLVILGLLAGLAAPVVSKSVLRSKEAALKENLQVLRAALDDFYADKGVYPSSPEELVENRYIRFIPEDPIHGETEWNWEEDDNFDIEGLIDVHSYSNKESLSGTFYSEW